MNIDKINSIAGGAGALLGTVGSIVDSAGLPKQPRTYSKTSGPIQYVKQDYIKAGDNTGATINNIGGGLLGGSGIGTAIAPGIGTVVGGLIGGIGSAIGSIFAGSSQADRIREENKRIRSRNEFNKNVALGDLYSDEFYSDANKQVSTMPTFKDGKTTLRYNSKFSNIMPKYANGKTPFTSGVTPGTAQAKVSKGEVIVSPTTGAREVVSKGTSGKADDVYTKNLDESMVFSNNKIPGTNTTYAKQAQEYLKGIPKRALRNDERNTGFIAAATDKLNKLNLAKQMAPLQKLAELQKITTATPEQNGMPKYSGGKPTQLGAYQIRPFTTVAPITTTAANPIYQKVNSEIAGLKNKTYGIGSIGGSSDSDGLAGVASGAIGAIGSLLPAISNIFAPSTPQVSPDQLYSATPKASVMRKLNQRRVNVQPAIGAVNDKSRVDMLAARNMTNVGGIGQAINRGIFNNSERTIADLYTKKQQIENDYAADAAKTELQIDDNNAARRSAAMSGATQLNMGAYAADRNVRNAGLSQLGGYFQNRELMKNQKSMDQIRLDVFNKLAKLSMSSSDIESIMSLINK